MSTIAPSDAEIATLGTEGIYTALRQTIQTPYEVHHVHPHRPRLRIATSNRVLSPLVLGRRWWGRHQLHWPSYRMDNGEICQLIYSFLPFVGPRPLTCLDILWWYNQPGALYVSAGPCDGRTPVTPVTVRLLPQGSDAVSVFSLDRVGNLPGHVNWGRGAS